CCGLAAGVAVVAMRAFFVSVCLPVSARRLGLSSFESSRPAYGIGRALPAGALGFLGQRPAPFSAPPANGV
ncbi:hypothetical protein, partial [Pseudomonas aeruginosa]